MLVAPVIPELYVDDLERSLAFYTALDFIVAYSRKAERFAMLQREEALLMVEEPVNRTFLASPLAHPRGSGINLQISVNDVDRLWTRLPEQCAVVLPIEERDYQSGYKSIRVRQFVVADPDGYVLRFTQHLS